MRCIASDHGARVSGRGGVVLDRNNGFNSDLPLLIRGREYDVVCTSPEDRMKLSPETLKAMIQDYDGIPLSDEELELVWPELENYIAAAEQLDELDLSSLFSGRLLRVAE
jgi:hypothetical protein